jgi:hypothetical protein
MKFLSLTLILSLYLTGCSNLQFARLGVPTVSESTIRLPASNVDEITYYLSVDKFKYYLNEYSVAQEGKIPDQIVVHLRNMSVEEIMKLDLDHDLLLDANNYDKMIIQILKDEDLLKGVTPTQLNWNYNFFKNKLNEAFALSSSKLDINLSLESTSTDINNGITIKPENLSPEDMTLDSGHYISNRTTRAIFWEANENNRPIEFHLGDSREFLKELKDKNGKILFEVKPFAKNYNKIYIIQYPGEKTYRYAITNIGGKDRLDHLTHQISLSNLSKGQLRSKVLVKGDLKKFHAARTEEHALQLRLLPHADRVIIGQKESIDGKFNLFWKREALKNLNIADQVFFQKKLEAMNEKDKAKYFALINSNNYEAMFKDKKVIEDTFALFEDYFTKNPGRLPAKFKTYNYDNFTVEMCDYVFSDNGKDVRWRVVSNVWGDEIIPIAQALKLTGNTNVTYMGTAGAFADKGYKVGDLVIPSAIRDSSGSEKMVSQTMKIEGAHYGGTVEHVGSPFEEDTAWLAKARAQSDFVEVETSYLRRIFNGPKDNIEFYLLISDILGSDTETLAHASSGKRKSAQNKLLAELFKRDAKSAPIPIKINPANSVERFKNIVFKVLEKKTAAYRYYVFSSLKDTPNITEQEIMAFSEKQATFTDTYLIDRLVKISEVIHALKKNYPEVGDFDIAFSKSLIQGTWNPKASKLNITIKAKNTKAQSEIEAAFKDNAKFLDSIKSFATFNTSMAINDPNMIWMKVPEKIDPDLLVKIYALAGFQNAGLYKNVTYNGNITLDFLPTSKTENPLEAFYQGTRLAPANQNEVGGTCIEAMRRLMQIM